MNAIERREELRWIAPPAPPCFAVRTLWIEFVAAAAEAQSSFGQPRVLNTRAGEKMAFNYKFDYCADCSVEYRAAMLAQGRCHPTWVRDRAPAEDLNAEPRERRVEPGVPGEKRVRDAA